jgi:putative transcriptional regulator
MIFSPIKYHSTKNNVILNVINTFRVLLEVKMIRCHLSRLMGENKMNIADVARETNLHRNTVTLLYKETATRVDLEAIDRLCKLFNCQVGDLLEYLD